MPQLILAFDVVNQKPVSFLGSAETLPDFRQGLYDVKIYLVQPATDFVPGAQSFEAVDSSDFDGLRAGFWSASTGTLNDSDANQLALTDQLGWTYDASDPDTPFFTGVLNLMTAEVAAFIGAAAYKAAYFAVNRVRGADLYPVFDQRLGGTNVTINAATDDGTGNGVSTTGAVPTMTLPVQLVNPATGHVFVISEIAGAPPTLIFTCLNP